MQVLAESALDASESFVEPIPELLDSKGRTAPPGTI